MKLNTLISDGTIPKNRLFYRYLSDVLEMYVNPNHKYHPDVIEFFSSIMYLGGRRTFNFIRGPMAFGQGKGFWKEQSIKDIKMNLGGPSESTCESRKARFTTKSGVIKCLNLIQYKLMISSVEDPPKPIVNNENLLIYPCVYSNDGTGLKPAVEFDAVSKTNVGLSVTVDINFIKENTPPDPKILNDLIITESVVGNITSLDNKMSLPVAVVYSTKSGKTGENLTKLFTDHIKILQMCESCTKLTKCDDLIINDSSLCQSYCECCYTSAKICEKCKEIGHASFHPALRSCTKCVLLKQRCVKRAFFIITTDCEEGNKKMFLTIKEKIKAKTIDPYLSLLTPLPDPPHLGKSLKASFSNWFLKLLDERGCLSFLHTLRNKSGVEEMRTLKTLLPKNDYVKNKDRQDPVAVLKISHIDVTDYLKDIGLVGHTIIPETSKFTNNNKVGMHPNPISLSIGPCGYIYVLNFDIKTQSSKITKFQLHNPIDKFETIASGLTAISISYFEGRIFYCGSDTPLMFITTNKNSSDIGKMRSKTDVCTFGESIGLVLSKKDSLRKLKQSISNHLKKMEERYKKNNLCKNILHLTGEPKPKFQAFSICDDGTIIAASSNTRKIVKILPISDGYVIFYYLNELFSL